MPDLVTILSLPVSDGACRVACFLALEPLTYNDLHERTGKSLKTLRRLITELRGYLNIEVPTSKSRYLKIEAGTPKSRHLLFLRALSSGPARERYMYCPQGCAINNK